MVPTYDLYQQPLWIILSMFMVLLWAVAWKGIGLWYSARYKQKGWFIAILVLNTLGLLPIIYLIWFRPSRERNSGAVIEVKPKKVRRKK